MDRNNVPLRLELYSGDQLEKVRAFNGRLRKGNVQPSFLLPERAASESTKIRVDPVPGPTIIKRHFLVVDEEEIRGGFLLQEQFCHLAGQTRSCANIQMPISEGIVDRKFTHIAARMIELLLQEHPFVFAVGMGSLDAPFAKLLAAMKWRVMLVPLRFFVLRPAHLFKQLPALRDSRWRSVLSDFAANTGIGSAAILATQRLRRRRAVQLCADRISTWDTQISLLWTAYRSSYSFCAVRDAATLPFFLDLAESNLSAHVLRDRDGIPRGWGALKVKAMQNNKYFGSLHVATLLDAVCEPGFESAMLQAMADCARVYGADILLMNQLCHRWLIASEQSGFWKGPSNYIFSTSPALTKEIAKVDDEFSRVHCSRADGDGRVNL